MFERGRRPDLDLLKAAVSGVASLSISHDGVGLPEGFEDGGRSFWPTTDGRGADVPSHSMTSKGPVHWAELLRDGFTFDLVGLLPGPGMRPVEWENRFDLPAEADPLSHSFVSLWPGPHLSGAESSLPVVRALLQTAQELAAGLDAMVGIGWRPSSGLIGTGYFSRIVTSWATGGPFPALGLVAFRPAIDGALQSVGLEFFTGQEVRIEGQLGEDRKEATKLGARLVNELIGAAPLEEPLPFTGPGGQMLRMEPSANGRFVRVWMD